MWKLSKQLTLNQCLKSHGQQITLLMGLPDSGSTALQIHSPYSHKVMDTPLYGVYTHKNNTLIACYSTLVKQTILKKQQHHWQSLLKALQKKKVACLMTVSVAQLINRKEPLLHKQLKLLLQRFQDLQLATQGNFHITLVFTQLDHLVGFSEYFSFCHNHKKTSVFGINLHKSLKHPLLLEQFDQKFHEFMEDVNVSLLKNIEQSTTRTQRGIVKDFPIQLESLRKPIASFLQDMISSVADNPGDLNGLYFTSCQQDPLVLDRLHKIFQQRFSINHELYKENKPNSTLYFLSGLWEKIQNNSALKVKKPKKLLKIFTLGALSIFFIGYGGYLYYGYNTHKQWIANGEKTFIEMHYLLSSEQGPHALLVALQSLQHLAKRKKIINPLQPHMTTMISHDIQKTYIKNLHKTLYIVLQHQLQWTLKYPESRNAAMIYQTLKAYLMLSRPQDYDPHYLTQAFKQFFQNEEMVNSKGGDTFFVNAEKDLMLHPPQMILDPSLITQAQHYLLQLPTETLALAKLPSHNASLKEKVHIILLNQQVIPPHYQKKYLPLFYYEIIPLIAKETLEGDWVLAQPKLTTYAVNNQWQALSDAIRGAYLKEYVAFWQNNIATYESIQFKNIDDAHKILKTLVDGPQSLWHQWQVIRDNIMLSDHAINTVVSKDFTTLVSFLENDSHINHIQQRLKALDEALVRLIQAKDLNYSAYELAKKRYTHTLAKDPWVALTGDKPPLPEPFDAWLNAIAQQSWHGVMAHAGEYVKEQWQLKVHIPFSQMIADKYPYAPQGTSESTPADMAFFFSPSGVLATFYGEFLVPFVTANKQGQWTWQSLNGSQLEEDPFLLQQLQCSATLLTLLYPAGQQKIVLTEQLTPLALEPGIKNMILKVNNHHGKIYPESRSSFPIRWTPTDPHPLVSLSLTNHEGEHFHIRATGPWAWFHLLDKAQWSAGKGTNHWLLTFDIADLHSEWDYSNNKAGTVALILLRDFVG